MLLVSFRASVWLLQVLVLHFFLISRIQDRSLTGLEQRCCSQQSSRVLLDPCREITSCMDGASTVLLQPPCSIAGHSWGDISTMRSSLLAGYIFLQVFPRGLLVTLWLQFLCCEDFRRLVFPFPRYPDVAPPQGLRAAVAPSAVMCWECL